MYKIIPLLLSMLIFSFYTASSFAFGPGAGQAQMRNNMQQMEQNKQMIKQQKALHRQREHQQKAHEMQQYRQ